MKEVKSIIGTHHKIVEPLLTKVFDKGVSKLTIKKPQPPDPEDIGEYVASDMPTWDPGWGHSHNNTSPSVETRHTMWLSNFATCSYYCVPSSNGPTSTRESRHR